MVNAACPRSEFGNKTNGRYASSTFGRLFDYQSRGFVENAAFPGRRRSAFFVTSGSCADRAAR